VRNICEDEAGYEKQVRWGERGSKKELGSVRVEKRLGQLLNVGASVGEELIITAPQGCGYC